MSPPAEEHPDDPTTLLQLEAYLEALHAGRQPDKNRLLKENPHLGGLLDCLESLDRLAPPPAREAGPSTDLDPTLPFDPRATAADGAALPMVFGKYELLEEIGRGGMGVVYRARQADLDRLVAVKMILASNLASEEQVLRFHSEARAAARLIHPHIVQIHDTGQVHGQHFFVMEHVTGPSLAKMLQHGPLPVETAARLLAAVARAVAELHAHGIVHRDLKPSNVLLQALDAGGPRVDDQPNVSGDLSPKITDFGLAKMLGTSSGVTYSGAILGTPSYMAPEQAAGRHAEVGPPSDIYSLGAILYEMLTGRPPFHGETPLDTLVQVLETEPVLPRHVNPKVPRELEMICLKCLEKAPENRYPTAAAVADDLERFQRGEAVEAPPQALWQRVRRWVRREPALACRLGALLVFALVVHVSYWLFRATPLSVHLEVLGILAGWALLSLVFQRLLRNELWSDAVRFAWAAADVIALTALLELTDNQLSPLAACYPLVVVASGLWFRVRLVWFTTILSELAYALLIVRLALSGTTPGYWHHHALFMLGLVVVGLVVAYQVRRVRALSRYYEHRRL